MNRIPATGRDIRGAHARSLGDSRNRRAGRALRARRRRSRPSLDEWTFGWGTPPPRPLDSYDAVLVFGGAMHADQDAHHPWLARRDALAAAAARSRHSRCSASASACSCSRARPAHGSGRCRRPRDRLDRVELTDEGAADPVLGSLPRSSKHAVASLHVRRCRPAPSSSRAAPRARRRSAWATRAGACSSIPRSPRAARRLGRRHGGPSAGSRAIARGDARDIGALERARTIALRGVPGNGRALLARRQI